VLRNKPSTKAMSRVATT